MFLIILTVLILFFIYFLFPMFLLKMDNNHVDFDTCTLESGVAEFDMQ